jgi:hypothetical protein
MREISLWCPVSNANFAVVHDGAARYSPERSLIYAVR